MMISVSPLPTTCAKGDCTSTRQFNDKCGIAIIVERFPKYLRYG
ncbi:MAG TPA: hypothetical protein VI033_02335 [Candidatus Nitrosopolaris sp.]